MLIPLTPGGNLKTVTSAPIPSMATEFPAGTVTVAVARNNDVPAGKIIFALLFAAQARALFTFVIVVTGPHARTSAPAAAKCAVQHPPPEDGICEPPSPPGMVHNEEVEGFQVNVTGSESPGLAKPSRTATE